jgi:hypothetical protein
LSGIYIIGDVLTTTPNMQLLLNTIYAGVPQYYPAEVNTSVAAYLTVIQKNLQLLDANKTIMGVGRYCQDPVSYQGFNFINSNSDPPPFLFLFSNLCFPSDPFVASESNQGLLNLDVLNNPASRAVMLVADFNTTLPYFDNLYVFQDYVNEKLVSAFIAFTSNYATVVTANETQQLYNTFSLKNVMINGVDLGGEINGLIVKEELDLAGYGIGFNNVAGSLLSYVDVMAGPVVFGATGEVAPTPDAYDYRYASNSNCLAKGFSQGDCQNCWAVSSTLSARTRYCLSGKTAGPAPISIGHVTSCADAPTVNGCVASHPMVAYTFMGLKGAISESCFPSKTITCTSQQRPCPEQPCQVTCTKAYDKYTNVASPAYYSIINQVAYESDLYHNGPFSACFSVPTDFTSFFAANPTGCYANENTPTSGGHCVMAIAYDASYLYFRNSWGTGWGNKGDFCIKKGMARTRKGSWFTNEGWAGTAGAVTTYSNQATVPANSGRDPAVVLSSDQINVPTPKPPTPSGAPFLKPNIFFLVSVLLLLITSLLLSSI